ncbi:two-partner secretion domain-containing protein [Burkholderia metallica]|uniref:two-partner secretion domain-containing protein n=1 Tax=Burkholderia metallica TaxID=488729 RepID=UPI0034A0A3A0
MNKNRYRLMFDRTCAVPSAMSGKTGRGKAHAIDRVPQPFARLVARYVKFATMLAAGAVSIWANAQIVGGGAHAPSVIQTPTGLPQVNINKPSAGSGVSMNTYNQFDVGKPGAILNNSPTAVNTQLSGYINGNPNFGPNDAARVIVNQVNSNNPSLIRGPVEIAGQRAEIILSNSAGLQIDGGAFINTSRAVLTTGAPYFNADGSVAGFNVSRGLVTVSGSGLNASNVDQLDIISRAVQANAAIYANKLNVVAGANQVNHDTLSATPIQGDGPAPSVAIDVGQLGGMFAQRIFLIGTERGVGVANAGTIAAQAGDLTLQSNGLLILSGKTTASGNLTAHGSDVQNTGTTYSQQNANVSADNLVSNNGTIGAQQNVTINAASLNSTGGIGAGANSNGAITRPGNLQIATTGALVASGQNLAGGDATLTGGSVNLSASQTAANGNLTLNANAGDLNLSHATTSAQGSLNATASGALVNDQATLSSQKDMTLTAGSLSNVSGTVSSQGPLVIRSSGQVQNQSGILLSQNTAELHGGDILNSQGIVQSAGKMLVDGASLQNSGGRVVSLNGDGLTVATTGLLSNVSGTTANGAQGGVIGGSGNVQVKAGTLANHGVISASGDLKVDAQSADNSNGSLAASHDASINAGTSLTNASGSISAANLADVRATTLDNGSGSIEGSQLSLTAIDLKNVSGTITQTGSAPTTVAVSNSIDNTSGVLTTNSTDLSLTPATLINDRGQIQHSGSGTLTIGTGKLSNQSGSIATNGALALTAGAVSNQSGKLSAQKAATLDVQSLDNSANGYIGADSVALKSQGAINNRSGLVEASHAVTVSADSLANDSGTVQALGSDALSVTTTNALTNTANGKIGGNGDVSVTAGSIDSSNGSLLAKQSLTVQSNGQLKNSAGLIQANLGNLTVRAQGVILNDGGQVEVNGQASAYRSGRMASACPLPCRARTVTATATLRCRTIRTCRVRTASRC